MRIPVGKAVFPGITSPQNVWNILITFKHNIFYNIPQDSTISSWTSLFSPITRWFFLTSLLSIISVESPISRTSVRNSFNYHFTGKKNNSTFEHSIITCRAVETWTIINMKINKARLINGITDFADVIYRYHWRLINSREGQRFFRRRKVVKTLENSRATGVIIIIIIISIWHRSKIMMIEVSFQLKLCH